MTLIGAIHPFMTSTRRGRGQTQVDACGRGRMSASRGRPLRKLDPTEIIPSLLMQRSWQFFGPEFRLRKE